MEAALFSTLPHRWEIFFFYLFSSEMMEKL